MLTENEYKDFVSLVKRMREAQKELGAFEHGYDFFQYEVIMKRKELISKVIKLESEVDEYLKKMEEQHDTNNNQHYCSNCNLLGV